MSGGGTRVFRPWSELERRLVESFKVCSVRPPETERRQQAISVPRFRPD